MNLCSPIDGAIRNAISYTLRNTVIPKRLEKYIEIVTDKNGRRFLQAKKEVDLI